MIIDRLKIMADDAFKINDDIILIKTSNKYGLLIKEDIKGWFIGYCIISSELMMMEEEQGVLYIFDKNGAIIKEVHPNRRFKYRYAISTEELINIIKEHVTYRGINSIEHIRDVDSTLGIFVYAETDRMNSENFKGIVIGIPGDRRISCIFNKTTGDLIYTGECTALIEDSGTESVYIRTDKISWDFILGADGTPICSVDFSAECLNKEYNTWIVDKDSLIKVEDNEIKRIINSDNQHMLAVSNNLIVQYGLGDSIYNEEAKGFWQTEANVVAKTDGTVVCEQAKLIEFSGHMILYYNNTIQMCDNTGAFYGTLENIVEIYFNSKNKTMLFKDNCGAIYEYDYDNNGHINTVSAYDVQNKLESSKKLEWK